jgi:cation diffusion facilitator CzcD-associated flavoprotein CzcO
MNPKVAIIGAGMSGLCMAVKLQEAGIDSYAIFEQASDVGGTWRDNTYPRLTCDIPSWYYSFRSGRTPNGHDSCHPALRFRRTSARWPMNGTSCRTSASIRK